MIRYVENFRGVSTKEFFFVLMRASAKEDKKISLIYIIFNIYSSRPWGNCGKPRDCPKMALLGGFLRFLAIFRLLLVVENRGKTRNDFHSYF